MVKDTFRNDRGSMFKSMKSSLMKAMSLNPFSRVPTKAVVASDHQPKVESLAQQGTRLLAMVKQLQLSSVDSTAAIQPQLLIPKAAQVPDGPRESAPTKRLFSATDLQAISLRGNTKTLAAPPAPAPAAVKSKLLPFSALDLSKVQLKRKTAGVQVQGQGKVQGQSQGQGQGQIKATPLHEQLKRALQRKFSKVRSTPTPGPGQSDVADEEWDD